MLSEANKDMAKCIYCGEDIENLLGCTIFKKVGRVLELADMLGLGPSG